MPETITVMPFTRVQRLRLKWGRDPAFVLFTMQRWFHRWAKRHNCGINLRHVRLETESDVTRPHARPIVYASVEMFDIPVGSGLEPGYVVDVPDA